VALVMWFRAEWIDGLIGIAPELAVVRPMLSDASRGLQYSDETIAAVRPTIEAMVRMPSAERLLALLDVLVTLATDTGAVTLATPDRRQHSFAASDRPRVERVLDHIHGYYQEQLNIPALADLAHLSTSGLHRLFKRHTRMTVMDYVAQLRVGRACQLLISTPKSIAHVAAEVGYENLSHFNRQFRALKHATPREFRRGFVR